MAVGASCLENWFDVRIERWNLSNGVVGEQADTNDENYVAVRVAHFAFVSAFNAENHFLI